MLTLDSYSSILSGDGNVYGNIRKSQSDRIMDDTFTHDVSYKKVYILDAENGWKYEDARYQKHATISILRDDVDYYLQFRPKVHYPIGTYVFIPDDTSFDIGFSDYEPLNPFKDEGFDLSKLWIIVNRNNSKNFVRYNILPCNWNFRWIVRKNGAFELMNCYGAVRSANSYTSGVWSSDRSTALDNIINAWLPDTHLLFGDKIKDYELHDTRYLTHELRFMLTNNKINPNVYEITKVTDLSPQGIIKLTLKQDEYDQVRDNVDLLLCDYYDDSGEIKFNEPDLNEQYGQTSTITWMFVNDDGELIPNDGSYLEELHLGKLSYFSVEFSDDGIEPEWRTQLIGEEYTEEERKYYERLLVLTKFDSQTIAIRPGKASSLIGKQFKLTVQDAYGSYKSEIELEVMA